MIGLIVVLWLGWMVDGPFIQRDRRSFRGGVALGVLLRIWYGGRGEGEDEDKGEG